MTSARPAPRALRRLTAAAGAVLFGAGLSAAIAVPASAEAGVGYVRLAHLSPDTPPVDVYVDDLSGKVKGLKFDAVAYGVMSDYLSVPPGTYAVSMRKVAADPKSPPVLTEDVKVTEGSAHTVAGTGRFAELGLSVIDDDISAPPADQAKIRVLQASVKAPSLDIKTTGGQEVGMGLQFATTSAYRDVKPGNWTLDLQPQAGSAAKATCRLAGGTTYSLLVLDGKNGLTTDLKVDAKAGEITPVGGVETGAGGASGTGTIALVGGLGLVALAGVVGVAAVGLRRRAARRTW
ncbi:hypothetical protein Ais01nite_61660 [Asanoa ishikariensis]|uniref:DUF4397 domain-containing protein n=1 Tax=Asanoa ishikariensis TaxID=137265 RepID=A0A1H3P467_9ACTN|nr:DUF4397 domain-containing protein [Asanoa ishikariensis]GIF68131.1 hypothetical protein Ais01nite_61660 [Asanoa ishikariensis]SDY95820.1 protein of unknown function [Asanoa ishikariensis]